MTDQDAPDLFSWRPRRGGRDEDRRPEPRRSPAAGRGADEREILTVSEITARIRKDLETNFQGVWVAGEISNLSRPNSGHTYFTLKDDKAQLAAVLWKSAARGVRFELREGLAVLAHGDVTVYPPRGAYQIVVSRILPQGMGALQLALLQLKDRLEKEGLFDPGHKRPLPPLPRRIGIVTSPSGAAIRDILKQVSRRFPGVEILLYPASVQGVRAVPEIVAGIHALNEYGGVEVMIVGRGGGSLENLWAFNDEAVARAIYASTVPVISAVGHEIDVTISDLVADVRALTPTAAGEMVVPDRAELLRHLARLQDRLRGLLVHHVSVARERLRAVEQASVLRRPLQAIRMQQQHLDEHRADLRRMAASWLAALRERTKSSAARLESLSPLKVLARGYSITFRPDGAIARGVGDLAPGDVVRTLLSRGSFTAAVKETTHENGRKAAEV